MATRSGIIHCLRAISLRQRFLGFILGVGCVLFLSPAAKAGILDLAWDAPTTNADGTPLTDLWGYRVYFGTSSFGAASAPCGSSFQDVPSPTGSTPGAGEVVTVRLGGLITGTTYFVRVTTVDFGGNESDCSIEATGLAQADPPVPGGDGGGACFVATAAFGSPLAAEVQVLREVRDRALLTHAPGRLLVGAYYRASPPLAELIRQDELLRAVIRGALWPVVWWARLALASPALALAIGGGGLVAGPLLAFLLLRARRARANGRSGRTQP